jgi:hypothetical protein
VTIIVPTRAFRERADYLSAAIRSVVSQCGVRAVPLVVLNGQRGCRHLERSLRADRRIRLLELEEAGLPAALRAGREAVDTPFFATLDDDDVLVPGGIALRVSALEAHPDRSVVVSNGIVRDGDTQRVHLTAHEAVEADPLRAMLRANWLLPGSWLARSDEVQADIFEGMPANLECTFLALRFAVEYRMLWLREPTVIYHAGTPGAQTLARDFVIGQAAGLEHIMRLPLPEDVRRVYRDRVGESFHEAAHNDLQLGAMTDAWRWHLASLGSPGGLRYLSFTRHLLLASLSLPL